MRKIKGLLIALCTILLVGCGSNEDKAVVPFGNTETTQKTYDEVKAELSEAGFENISTETITTTLDSEVGAVTKITIDGSGLFTKLTAYEKDVPVVITYKVLQEETATAEDSTEVEEEQTGPEKAYEASTDSLKELATDLFDFEYDNLDVTYDADSDDCYVVAYRITEYADITSYVNKNVNRYIHFLQRAYAIDGVDRVRFDVNLLGQDQYGQDYEITGIQELMTKETYSKFNWENLGYQNIWETMNDECYYFGIAPEIIGDVDTEKIFYDSFERDGKID